MASSDVPNSATRGSEMCLVRAEERVDLWWRDPCTREHRVDLPTVIELILE
jgi:hypothetical protein